MTDNHLPVRKSHKVSKPLIDLVVGGTDLRSIVIGVFSAQAVLRGSSISETRKMSASAIMATLFYYLPEKRLHVVLWSTPGTSD